MPNVLEKNEAHFLETIAPFLRSHPGTRVEVTVLRWEDAWARIEAALKGAPGPDIAQLGTTWTATAAASGGILDLTGQFSEALFSPAALATTSIAGPGPLQNHRFAVPFITDVRALYYNKTACAKAGVNPEKDFETWAGFKAALKKLNGIEINGRRMAAFGMPAKSAYDALNDFSWWIWGAGGDFLLPDTSAAAVNSREAVEGIEFYVSLQREGLMSRVAFDRNSARVMQMLRDGELATTIHMRTPELPADIGITAPPAGPHGRFTFLGGSNLAVLRSSRHREQAVELIKYLATESAQEVYSRGSVYVPAAARKLDESRLKSDPGRLAFMKLIELGRSYPSIPEWGAVEEILRSGLGSLWDGVLGRSSAAAGFSVKTEMDRLAARMDEQLRHRQTAGPKAKPAKR